MTRILKKNVNTPFFHIMVQGVNREAIFTEEKDIRKFIRIMKETKEKIDVIILSYCIMNNHAHFLIYEENMDFLSRFMHDVNLRYAKYYNEKYSRIGHVFRDRFKMQLIDTERYLQTCIKYIHNNPVKANICRSPAEYPYSSFQYNVFFNPTDRELELRKKFFVDNNMDNIKVEDKEFVFLEVEENSVDKNLQCQQIAKDFMEKNKITAFTLKKDKKNLGKLILKMKIENNISYKVIGDVLGISRETIRKLCTK